MTARPSPKTGSPLPKHFDASLRLAKSRTNSSLRRGVVGLEGKLRGLGMDLHNPVDVSQILDARKLAKATNRQVWRDVARNIEQQRIEASIAAIDSYDIPAILRQAAVSRLQSMIPSLSQSNSIVRGSSRDTEGWLDGIIGKLAAQQATGQEVINALTDFVDPNTPGGLAFSADRLTQDQLSQGFHDAQIETADILNIQVLIWRLDAGHDVEDDCDDLDGQTFAPEDVPDLPHVGCQCFLEEDVTDAQLAEDISIAWSDLPQ
jgi:hypothetical protein